jgi:hypothetical protein
MKNNKVKVVEKDIKEVAYDRRKEKELPNIVIDTNIWGRMTQAQIDDLRQFNDHYGFKYFFSSINCIETFVRLDTHFEQQKKALQNMVYLCGENILLPEEVFLRKIGLESFVEWWWKKSSLLNDINAIASASVNDRINVDHYKNLKKTDQNSYNDLRSQFPRKSPTFEMELNVWIYHLLIFFLVERPLNQVWLQLPNEQKNEIVENAMASLSQEEIAHNFYGMAKKRMFHKNDVYDALQFIPPLLSENRTVITCDKKMLTFSNTYKLDEFIQRHKI